MRLHLRTTTARAMSLGSALVLSTLVACGGAERESAGDVAAGTTPAATTTALRVADVELGRGLTADKRVQNSTDDFTPNDTIYASVRTTGAATNATVMARWTFQDGQVVQESTQTIAPTGDANTEFHISKPDGLPKGNYKVEIFLNGQSVETEEFEVK
jgi:hypothetical protein